jgi:hypothetical protein
LWSDYGPVEGALVVGLDGGVDEEVVAVSMEDGVVEVLVVESFTAPFARNNRKNPDQVMTVEEEATSILRLRTVSRLGRAFIFD